MVLAMIRTRRCWWAPLFLGLSVHFAGAQQIDSQIERARNFIATPGVPSPVLREDAAPAPPGEVSAKESDAGEQWLLKMRPERHLYSLSASASGQYTDNVALTRRGGIPERYLIADAGGSARIPLASWLQGELDLRFSIFRYEEFRQLDFNSIDAGTGLSASISSLWGLSPFLRYNFTALFSDETGDTFFKNHTVTLGAQKIFSLAPAHYIWTGGAAAFGFSDPAAARRNEYSLFAGYHLDATRALGLDLSYRIAWLQYVEGDRDDLNQSVSLGLRYRAADWLSASGSVSYTHNVSNSATFDYQAFNTGVGLSLSIRF